MNQPRSAEKPFAIPKQAVVEAFRKVRANQGGPGVDGCTIEEFESDLRNRLYVTWNRMSSGSYFPPPVKAVAVPKPHGGGVRMLGVPTVADRVAQTVVAMELEKVVEPKFHPSSYGYRPGRSPLDAVAACRQRCFTHPWVLDCDIAGFFDNVLHDLIVKAVEANTDLKWVVLYVKRWLKAPIQHEDGTLERRDRGTPQGSAISPLLANLFLHYALDQWMAREFPTIPFERYCDDIVVHCVSEKQTRYVGARIAARLGEVGLRFPGVHFPQAHGPGRAERRSQRLSASGQSGRDGQDESRRTGLATASVDHAVTERTRGMGQQDRARVAQLLRPVLQDRVAAASAPNKRLHPAVGSQEVQAATGVQEGQGVVEQGHETRSWALRALAMDEQLLTTG